MDQETKTIHEERSTMRPWIKMHTTKLDDVRLLRLNERQQLRFFQLYLLAGRLNADGSFVENGMQLDEVDIAIKLRVKDANEFAKDFKALKAAKLIRVNGHGPIIGDFAEEQVDWSRKQELDRERQERKRHGGVTRDENLKDDKSRKGHGGVTRLDQDQTKKKIKKETKKEKKIKTTTNHDPSSSSQKSRRGKQSDPSLAGGGGKDDSTSSVDQQLAKIAKENPGAAETMRIMRPILTADGLGKQKFKTLMVTVAIRTNPRDAKRTALAALASSYADESAHNKTIVAAHRLENEQVPSQYFNPATWNVIPENVLQAAGIDNLNEYIASTGGARTVSGKAALLRARSS
jgi:hypothetical protein